MNRSKPVELIIAGWINDLSLAVVGSNTPLADAKARVAVLTAAMYREFPDASLFTKESLLAISRQNRFMPSFSELSEQLAEWREAHRPRVFVPPPELDTADLSGQARAMVMSWLMSVSKSNATHQELVTGLSVVRRYAPEGYRWLLGQHTLAKDIAIEKGWQERTWAPPTAEDMEAVAEKVRPFSAPIVAATKLPLPHGPSVQPQPQQATTPDFVAAFQSKHGRPPGALPDEALQKLREANIGVQRARALAAEIAHERQQDDDPPPPPEDIRPNWPGAKAVGRKPTRKAVPWDEVEA